MRIVILKFLPLVFLCCLVSAMTFSQEKYFVVDSISASVKANSIEELHQSLTKNHSTDEEKLRAFYFWITHNINYDVAEWTNPTGNFAKQEPENVFKNKKAVCHGYSKLFDSLCKLSGIKCFVVSGYIKKYNVFINEGHAWNVVYVNNQWLPVDATWGAGGVDENRKFVKDFQEKYFLANPLEFLTDHYPFDPAWQLVTSPVALDKYRKKEWKYVESPGGKLYNFNDTISHWMQNDSTTMLLLSAQRMMRMNPTEPESKRSLSYAMMGAAQEESMKGDAILAHLFPESNKSQSSKSGITISDSEFNIKLDSAYKYFSNADNILKKIIVTSQEEKTYVTELKEVLKHNMYVIETRYRK